MFPFALGIQPFIPLLLVCLQNLELSHNILYLQPNLSDMQFIFQPTERGWNGVMEVSHDKKNEHVNGSFTIQEQLKNFTPAYDLCDFLLVFRPLENQYRAISWVLWD